jgi:hypothetical protein
MIRLLLVALGGWVAWHYRDRIKELVKEGLQETERMSPSRRTRNEG